MLISELVRGVKGKAARLLHGEIRREVFEIERERLPLYRNASLHWIGNLRVEVLPRVGDVYYERSGGEDPVTKEGTAIPINEARYYELHGDMLRLRVTSYGRHSRDVQYLYFAMVKDLAEETPPQE